MSKTKEFVAFISHSSVEARTAELICQYLENKELKCWIAPRNIDYGKDYASQIMYGIEHSKLIILLLSENSNQSEQVLREVERAASKCIPILVIELERVRKLSKSLEYFISQRQWLSCHSEIGLPNLQPYVYEAIYNAVNSYDKQNLSFFSHTALNIRNNSKLYTRFLRIALVLLLLCGGISYFAYQQSLLTSVQELEKGSHIALGNYRNHNLIWTVVDKKLQDNNTFQLKLIAKEPVSYKPFDVAHSGTFQFNPLGNVPLGDFFSYYNYPETKDYENARGSNSWKTSVLRTWLNSGDEVVKYPFEAPNKSNVYIENISGYLKNEVRLLSEKGFLTSFTEEELKLLVKQQGRIEDFSFASNCALAKVSPDTILSDLPRYFSLSDLNTVNLEECKKEDFSDLVTIPSVADYKYNLENNLADAVSLLYKDFPENLVWLKNPCGNRPGEVCAAYENKEKRKKVNDYSVFTFVSNLAGVQPVIVVELPGDANFLGKGSAEMPYYRKD